MENEIQKRVVEMAKVFHEFCEKYGLKYYMVGGTMLGAIRHKGIIPWDDDIDFSMPREDYDRLIALKDNLDDKYTFNVHTDNPNYKYGFCKMYDESTTYLEQMSQDTKFIGGVYIDIFPLDFIGKNYNTALKTVKKISIRRKIIKGVFVKEKKPNLVKNICVKLLYLLPKSQKWFDLPYKLVKKYNKENSSYYINVYGAWSEKEVVPIEFFGTPRLYEFEDTQLYGVEKYDEFLTHMYGDYMTPPPLEKRGGHPICYINLNKPYKQYIEEQKSKKDVGEK